MDSLEDFLVPLRKELAQFRLRIPSTLEERIRADQLANELEAVLARYTSSTDLPASPASSHTAESISRSNRFQPKLGLPLRPSSPSVGDLQTSELPDPGRVLPDQAHKLLSEIPVGIAIVDSRDFMVSFVNRPDFLLGHSQDQLAGKLFQEIMPDLADRTIPILHQVARTGQPFYGPNSKDIPGQASNFGFVCHPLFASDGQVDRLMLIMTLDVSPDQPATQAASENDLTSVQGLEGTRGVMVFDHYGRLVWTDQNVEAIFGSPLPLLQEFDVFTGVYRPDGSRYQPRELPAIRAAIDGEVFFTIDATIIRSDGEKRLIRISAVPIIDLAVRRNGAVAVIEDITPKSAHADIFRTIEGEIELHHRLLQQREEERLVISRDLHDGPLQNLSALTYELQSLVHLAGEGPIANLLPPLIARLSAEVRALRDLASSLRPPSLRRFGLVTAIRSHTDTFLTNHPDLNIQTDLQVEADNLPDETRLALFRIYQEALNNASKHAQATKITVHLSISQGSVVLEIADNGQGFHAPPSWLEFARQGHLGIAGMVERAEAVGGKMEIASAPDQGTRVRVTIAAARDS